MIAITGVGMRFASGDRSISVLADVTLDIPARQFVAIAGPSGSGKSTLLGLIAGLDRPSTGRIRVAGADVTALSEDALARFRLATIGYIFQSFHLIPTLTALENVAVPLELAGEPDALPRAHALLAEVGLGERAQHYPVQLSGGEQQRRAARGRALRPCSWPMSPPAISTPPPASRSSSSSWASTARGGARSCSSPTIPRSPPTATGSSRSVTAAWWRTRPASSRMS